MSQSESLLVEARVRPIRAAYVIGPSHQSRNVVCSLIHHALSCWGGRYHLMIPTQADGIQSRWVQMLKALDPDTIFLVGDVPERLREELYSAIYPAHIFSLDVDPQAQYQPINTGLVSSYPIARHLTTNWMTHERLAFVDFDAPHSKSNAAVFENGRDFCAVNFGLADDDEFYRRSIDGLEVSTGPYSNGGISSVPGFLAPAIQRTTLTRKARASALSRMPFTPQNPDGALTLVIGDTADDIMYAWDVDAMIGWNGEFLAPGLPLAVSWVLWFPEELTDDHQLLWGVVWAVLQTGSMREPKLLLDSRSLDSQRLTAIAERLAKETPAKLKGLSIELRPGAGSTELMHVPEVSPNFTVGRAWTHRLPSDRGRHSIDLREPMFRHDPMFRGHYACDVALQMDWFGKWVQPEDYPDAYLLPQRSQMETEIVFERHEGARVNGRGVPVILLNANTTHVGVQVPEPESLFWRLTCQRSVMMDNGWPAMSAGPYANIRLSTEGQRFNALVQLFGDVNVLTHFLLDSLWSGIFKKAMGEDTVLKPMAHAMDILRELESSVDGLKNGDQAARAAILQHLSRSLVRVADQPAIVFQDMIAQAKRNFEERNPEVRGSEEKRLWSEAKERLCQQIDFFVGRGVLLRGSSMRCGKCGYSQWVPQAATADEPICSGCRTAMRFEAQGIRWSYRVNELIAVAYRDRGLLSTVDALRQITRNWRCVNPYCVGVELIDQSSQAVAEVDILGLEMGKLVIMEVKSHPIMLNRDQIRKTLDLAKTLDAAPVFACPGQPEDALNTVKADVEALGGAHNASFIQLDAVVSR